MIDFVIGLLQGLAFAFVLYGAYLATSWAGVRLRLWAPPLAPAESERRLVVEGNIEPRVERRRRTRRKTDRRRELTQDLYGLPM